MASKDQQVRDVVSGLALGVLAVGVEAVTSAKLTLEFAFNDAWRGWRSASAFPSIRGQDPGNMIWIGMGRSAGRVAEAGAWDLQQWAIPHTRLGGLDLRDCLEIHSSESVPVDDWIALGRLFVAGFKPDQIRHVDQLRE